MWLEMKCRGFRLTRADSLIEIAATLAAYRHDRFKSADISLLITLFGKIGFSGNERGKMNCSRREPPTHDAFLLSMPMPRPGGPTQSSDASQSGSSACGRATQAAA
jgi:hypothetical protein